MAVYTVHIPRSGEAEHAVFLRDGFSKGAFLFGPFWLFFRGAWISGAVLSVVIIAGALLLRLYGVQGGYLVGLSFLLMLLLGFEGISLIRLDLKLRKFSLAGVVQGMKPEDAETRFFASYLAGSLAQPVPMPIGSGNMSSANAQGAIPHPGIIGSFPHPSGGGRTGP